MPRFSAIIEPASALSSKKMRRSLIGGALVFICLCFAQVSSRFELRLPHGVASQTFFARYLLNGDNLGGWIEPHAGLDAYSISTLRNGLPAGGIKAIMYAPGCAIRTLSLPLSATTDTIHTFECKPVRRISLTGLIIPVDSFPSPVSFQARYIAYWASPFLGVGGGAVTVIPIGDITNLEADSHFHLTIPDLSQDPTVGTNGQAGEIQVWARDKQTGEVIAQLIPQNSAPLKTRMGGVELRPAYPPEIVFTPCKVNGETTRVLHDRTGFAVRPPVTSSCER